MRGEFHNIANIARPDDGSANKIRYTLGSESYVIRANESNERPSINESTGMNAVDRRQYGIASDDRGPARPRARFTLCQRRPEAGARGGRRVRLRRPRYSGVRRLPSLMQPSARGECSEQR